jgi:dTDP-4-amino-4,6-dideoxygalactose transaminase
MTVPFLDLKAQYAQIEKDIRREIDEVLKTTGFVLGPKVQAFESSMAELCGTKHCIAVNSGTAAVHSVLWAADLPPGSGVMVPPNTFTATVEPVILAGHVPVFVDVEEDYYTLSPEKVREYLEGAGSPGNVVDPKSGARVRAILSVDLYGQPADNHALEEMADEYGLILLEDACQAHGAELSGRRTGGFGLAGAFSFYPGKNLGAFGEGGAVTTDSDEMAEKVRMIRDHGSRKKFYYDRIGHNYRMAAFQGAVLGVKIKHIESWNERRAAAAARYDELLRDLPVKTPSVREGARHVFHLYVVHTPERDRLREHLSERGIASGLHYPIPLHLQKAYSHLGYGEGDFPVSERNSSSNITLPIFPEITPEQQEEVAEGLRDFFSG